MTTTDKINQALGVSCGKSLDDMLNDLNIEADEFHKTFDSLDENIGNELKKIDEKSLELQRADTTGVLQISDMNMSLKQIEDMIAQAKEVFSHVVANITSTDLLDGEIIHAASSLLESIHLNIAEFISIYKQKSKFVEKIKLMVFNQQQKIELANLKHKQNLELIEAKKKESVQAVDGVGEVFDTDMVVKSLAKRWDDVGQTAFATEDDSDDIIKEFEKEDAEEERQENSGQRPKTAE